MSEMTVRETDHKSPCFYTIEKKTQQTIFWHQNHCLWLKDVIVMDNVMGDYQKLSVKNYNWSEHRHWKRDPIDQYHCTYMYRDRTIQKLYVISSEFMCLIKLCFLEK